MGTHGRAGVVAVSAARPRWIDIRGRSTFTSIVREPSPRPLYFGLTGPEQNETAVHTEQVYAFVAGHYDHWAEALHVERSSWGWCHWGENLTLRGLSEHSLRIADRLRVGAALLEVTSPRIPCYKLAWRLGQPDSFLKVLIESGLMGFYLRVIEPGLIGAGDPVEVVLTRADSPTVAELSRLLHDDSVENVDVLMRAQAIEGLGSQCQEMIRNRINRIHDGAHAGRGRWVGWRRFRIESMQNESCDIKSVRLAPLDGDEIAGYRPGQFLTVRLREADTDSQIRTWSISEFASASGAYRLSIRRGTGTGSTWIHDHARVGSLIDVRPPSGRFVLDRGGLLRVVLISAGVGVTPLVSMLAAHAQRGVSAPPLLWVHSTTCGGTHAFHAEVNALLATSSVFERRVHYTRPQPGDVAGVDYDVSGRITAETIRSLVAERYSLSPFGRRIELGGDNSDFYVCGPREFTTMVRETLRQAGVTARAIREELFEAPAVAGPGELSPQTAVVRFQRSRRTVTWNRDDGLTLLELAERHDLRPEHGCRFGACRTCEVGLVAGEVRYVSGIDGDACPDRVLICSAVPASSDLVLDL